MRTFDRAGLMALLDTPYEEQDYASPGYSSDDPSKILRDPKFLNDLRDHYSARGRPANMMSDDQLIREFYSDRNWAEINTVGAIGDALDAWGMNAAQREKAKRIQQVWEQLPFFFQQGGRGWGAAKDIAQAALLDPVNVIGGVAAKGAAQAASLAGRGGVSATARGVGRAALTEGAIGAGQEAIVDTALQARDIQLGLQDEFSGTRLAGATALGGGLGGVIGGAIGIPGGMIGARQGGQMRQTLLDAGLSPEDISRLPAREAQALVEDPAALQRALQAVEEPAPDPAAIQPDTPFPEAEQRFDANIDALRRELDELKAEGADTEIVEGELVRMAELKSVLARLRKEDREITALEATNNPASLAEARKRRATFEQDYADFRSVYEGTDTLDVAELQDRYRQRAAAVAEGLDDTVEAPAADTATGAPTDPSTDPATGGPSEPSPAQAAEVPEPSAAARHGEIAPEAAPEVDPATPAAAEAAEAADPVTPADPSAQVAQPAQAAPVEEPVRATAAARALADAYEVNLGDVQPTGRNGLVLKADVERARRADVERFRAARAAEAAEAPSSRATGAAGAVGAETAPVGRLTNRARNYIEKHGLDEVAFLDLAATTPDGRIGVNAVRQLHRLIREAQGEVPSAQARTEGAAPQEGEAPTATQAGEGEGVIEAPERQPVPITRAQRNRLLAAGIDPDGPDVSPRERGGRVTDRRIEQIIEQRGDREPDEITQILWDETERMVRAAQDIGIEDPQLIRDVVALMSRSREVRSDADDVLGFLEELGRRDGIEFTQDRLPEISLSSNEEEAVLARARELLRGQKDFTPDEARAALATAQNEIITARGGDDPLTTTEKKLARDVRNVLREQHPDADPAFIEQLVTARVLAERGQKPPARSGTSSASDLSTKPRAFHEGAGLQSLLQRGTPIARGSDYTITGGKKNWVSKSDFAADEAILEARAGKGDNGFLPFKASGRMQVWTSNGPVEIKKGTWAWAHQSGRLVLTPEDAGRIVGTAPLDPSETLLAAGAPRGAGARTSAMREDLIEQARLMQAARRAALGDVPDDEAVAAARAQAAATDAQRAGTETPDPRPIGDRTTEQTHDLIRRMLTHYADDPDGFYRAIIDLAENGTEPDLRPRSGGEAATTKTPERVALEEKIEADIPLQRGDKLVMVRHKGDGRVRMAAKRQADDGKTIWDIIGRENDPTEWEFKYAPRELATERGKTVTRQAARERLWARLEQPAQDVHADATDPTGLFEAGNATGLEPPMTLQAAQGTQVGELAEHEMAALRYAAEVGGSPVPAQPEAIPVAGIYSRVHALESLGWDAIPDVSAHAEYLASLYSLAHRAAPGGLVMPATTREQSVAQLRSVLSRAKPDELAEAERLLTRLGGDPSRAPMFRAGDNAMATSYGPDGEQVISLDPQGATGVPRLVPVVHEVAHWAYFNILTPADRAEFWRAVAKHHAGNPEARAAFSGRPSQFDPAASPGGGTLSARDGGISSPQELWAAQFELYYTRSGGTLLGDESYWQRMSRYIKAIFDRYTKGAKIDPDLEPLLAKVLPDNADLQARMIGIDEPASTSAGQHIQKRWHELRLGRDMMDSAIASDSPDAIIEAARQINQTLTSIAPPKHLRNRSDSTARTGVLYALEPQDADSPVTKRKKRVLQSMMRQRANDIHEIITGKRLTPEEMDANTADIIALGEGGDAGMAVAGDPRAVADMLVDYHLNGYAGQFRPSAGVPRRIKDQSKTSVRHLLDDLMGHLEANYVRAEGGKGRLMDEPRSAGAVSVEQPVTQASPPRKRAKAKARKEVEKTEAKAKAAAGKRRSERSASDPELKASLNMRSIRERPESELVNLMRTTPSNKMGEDLQAEIGRELIRRAKATPPEPKPVEIPVEIRRMKSGELGEFYLSAVRSGDPQRLDQALAEFARRGEKRAAKIAPQTERMPQIIKQEAADNRGFHDQDGIPPAARASVREMLSYITHRDPDLEVTSRTLAYRMLNLLGRTVRDEVGEANILTATDVARMAGVNPSFSGSAVFADFRGPEFKKFRTDLRRMAIGLNKGDASPFDLMHEIGHVVLRSGMLPEAEMSAIHAAYRLADDETKTRIQKLYGGKWADRMAGERDALLAEEWFAESFTKYLGERALRGDIEEALTGNLTDASLRGRISQAIDRMVEHLAYMVNGLIGRQDIKQTFRRLTLYGDMFEQPAPRAPLARVAGGEGARVHSSMAAAYAGDILMSSPKDRIQRVLDFTGNRGLGVDADGQPAVFYHGTPRAEPFSRAANPNVVLEPSSSGLYGNGIYLTASPNVADQVYRRTPTEASMRRQIAEARQEGRISDDVADMLELEANNLAHLYRDISISRRDYADLKYAKPDPSDEVNFAIWQEDVPRTMQTLQRAIEASYEDAAEIRQILSNYGIVDEGVVLPVHIRALNPADFRSTASYDSNHPMIIGLTDWLVEQGHIEQGVFSWEGTLGGREVYQHIARTLSAYGVSNPENAINDGLRHMGYDSLHTVHMNSVTDVDGIGVVNYPHETVVIFDPENVKHIEAREFDWSSPELYERRTDPVPQGLSGSIALDMSESIIDGLPEIHSGALGEALERSGASPELSSAIMSMLRRRMPTDTEQRELFKFGPKATIMSQSDRMRAMGNNWLADWYKDIFPRTQVEFARRIGPIHARLRDLPDAHGAVRRWFKASTGHVAQKQPDSHARILRALRWGEGSRQEKALSDAERGIWEDIRATFTSIRDDLVASGVFMGDVGRNYVPQVWKPQAILKDETGFRIGMANYYKQEQASLGHMATDEQANEFAERMLKRLTDTDNEGIFVPSQGGGRDASADHVDFTRMIQLQRFPNALKEMEKFLEDDLEFLLVKYMESAARRQKMVEKMGPASHGFYDYMLAADQGVDGIARLLSTNKQFSRNTRFVGEDGFVEEGTLKDTILMPFSGREDQARDFAGRLAEVAANDERGGIPAARKMLMDIAPMTPDGRPEPAYVRRADAIIGALEDFKGQRSGQAAADFEFLENAMRLALRKPLKDWNPTLRSASSALKTFNSASLLGFVTLTSAGDAVLPMIRSGSFRNWADGLRKYATDPDYRRMMFNVGAAVESMIQDRLTYGYGGGDNRFGVAFFNAVGLTPWTDTWSKIAAAIGHESFVTMQAKAHREFRPGVPVADQSAGYKTAHRYLSRYGLQEFLPEGSRAGESLSHTRLIADDESVKLAMVKFSQDSIFMPNQNDIPMWAQHPIGSLMFQFKSFPLQLGRLGADVVREAKRGNLAPLIYFATIGPAGGAAVLAAKDYVQVRGGEDGRSPALRKRSILQTLGYDEKVHGNEDDFLGWYVEGMMQMGGLGLIGDMIHGIATQAESGAYGKTRMTSLFLGPSAGTFFGAVDVYTGAKSAILGGGPTNSPERVGTREIAARIPVVGGIRGARESIVDAVAGEPENSRDRVGPKEGGVQDGGFEEGGWR